MEIGFNLDKNGKAVCIKCGAFVGNGAKPDVNFCANCGTPLDLKSAAILEDNIAKEEICLLAEILNDIKNGENAESILAQAIKELKENIES